MRGLKFIAIALLSLLLIMSVFVGYLFLTAEVRVVNVEAQGVSAAKDAGAFEMLKSAIEEETFYGTLYQEPMNWEDASEYVYLTYTLHLRNDCLVPIDMIEVQVVPQTTDILQLPDLEVKSLDAKSEGEMKVQILAPKNSHSIRELIVTYYLWGFSGTVKTVFGQS